MRRSPGGPYRARRRERWPASWMPAFVLNGSLETHKSF